MENTYSVHLRDDTLDVVRGVRVTAQSEAEAISDVTERYRFYSVVLDGVGGEEFEKILMGTDEDDVRNLVDKLLGGDVSLLSMEVVADEGLTVDSVRDVTDES